jgi:peptidylprolyl isomerase
VALERPTIDKENRQPPQYLEIDDLVIGDGPEARPGNDIEVHYVGVSLSTGVEFDASWNRNQSFVISLGAGQVIKGWDQGLAGMKVGGRRKLTIPPHLGYGNASPTPAIKAGETLIFVVDLLAVR